jgi:2-polyprenyl-3-methyl-5-hydroxy-6-metoxy-1,4-benzoquinol methylase
MKDNVKEQIRAFWQHNPLFVGETDLDTSTRAFFEHHESVYRGDVFASRSFPDSFFPFPPGASVLDIGCGPGIWTRELARRGYRAVGIDLTERAVELTRRSLTLFDLSAEVQQADAERLPFPDESFDGVVSHGVIHHTPDTQQCVREIARVLKTGGLAVVSVYYRNFILRSPALSRLAARLIGRVVSLPGRGREQLLRSGNPDEIVRLYDGSGNPLGKAYTATEFEPMFTQAGLSIIGRTRYYVPSRAFGALQPVIRAIQPWLAGRFGLMYTVIARK